MLGCSVSIPIVKRGLDFSKSLRKSNRLEFYTQSEDALILRYTRVVYGKIIMLDRLQPEHSSTEHLFVGTDRYKYFTLSWDDQTHQLRTEQSFRDQADKTLRDSQMQDKCLIDPNRKYMTLQLYDGVVTVIPIHRHEPRKKPSAQPGTLGEPVPARIPELSVRSSAFIRDGGDNDEKPKLALLHEDNRHKTCLTIRQLDFTPGGQGDPGSADLDHIIATHDDVETGASHLVPVPGPIYGLLVLGETSITYYSQRHVHSEPLEEASIFVAWAQIDSQRWILADDYGKLYFLMLVTSGPNVRDIRLDEIGLTSRASCLIYIGDGHVFVGSQQGDSQLIKIQKGSIEVIQIFNNIAPIMDLTIMDMGSRTEAKV